MDLPLLESVLTCPHCGVATAVIMPTDSCLYFYECASCHTLLRPKPGDCCVFCSYGSVQCPPIQMSSGCGGDAAASLKSSPRGANPASPVRLVG